VIASGRVLLTCLALAFAAAGVAPVAAEAAPRLRHPHRVAHVVAIKHHRPAHHATRVARAGGETVRIIRAHPRRTATATPNMLTRG
jgi:hypothetical protein